MHEYSQADLTRLFHLTKTLLRGLAGAGYITSPARAGKTAYSFQDLLILRTASALQGARIPATKILKALGNIRENLPPGALLSTLSVGASGKELVLRDGARVWDAGSGQFSLPLAAARAGDVAPITTPRPRKPPASDAQSHYARAHALEESDAAAARAAYLAAIALQPDHIESRINLGRLLHMAGELEAAEKIYRQTKKTSALLSFNLAILMEDLKRDSEAGEAYRTALALDPQLHDAHFNLSRLHERAQQPREALRHLLAYRRHVLLFGE